ncbi:hypothetical protein BDK51DRAFT_27827, partial [Blyttiomyces helicus]
DIRPAEEHNRLVMENKSLRKQVRELEDSERSGHSKLKALQHDYHTLITIATELVQTLAACINGEQITPAYLETICERLGSFKKGSMRRAAEVDRRAAEEPTPPSRGSLTPRHPASGGSGGESEHHPHVPPSHGPTPSASQAATGPPTRAARSGRLPLEQYMDYATMAQDLAGAGRDTTLLLQALRMRLSQAPTAKDRRKILATMVANDFLQVNARKSTLSTLLASPSDHIREQTVRLLAQIASDRAGRAYLSTSSGLITRLVETVKGEERESIVRQKALGALQQLSLR